MVENIDHHEHEPFASVASSRLKRVVDPVEIPLYHEFGLGRGVNVTDADMWKSKTPYLVREAKYPDLENSNIIGTQECGILERYSKEVSTFEIQKQKLWLSLDNPVGSLVKIGMDEQSSRSSSSTKLIEGEKIENRTISFQFHFDDVPLYDDIDEGELEAPDCFLQESNENKFEEDLANWFLKRIEDREKKSKENKSGVGKNLSESGSKKLAIKKLADKLDELEKIGGGKLQVDIKKDCEALINYLGITHYISAIKLGACYYHVVTSRSMRTLFGANTSMAGGSISKGGLSGFLEKQFSFRGEEEQMIGIIDRDKKKVTTEAVIGFEIQPLYKLVRIQFIQILLRKAIKVYIKSKDNSKFFCFGLYCRIATFEN